MRDPGIAWGIGFASTTMDIFSPRKSVIVDMIMVQLLSFFVVISLILLTQNSNLQSNHIAWLMAGMLVSILMTSAVYARISSI